VSNGKGGGDVGIKKIFALCREGGLASEPSFFERHTTELVQDALYAARLESSFGENEDDEMKKKKKGHSEALEAAIRNAIGNARKAYGGGVGGDDSGGDGSGGDGSGIRGGKDQLNMTLSELIAGITKDI
jgi:hypothetical protein